MATKPQLFKSSFCKRLIKKRERDFVRVFDFLLCMHRLGVQGEEVGGGLISRKGGGQHLTLQTLGRSGGSLRRIPAAYVGRHFGNPTGVAPITLKNPFPGYFTNHKISRTGALKSKESLPGTGRDDVWPGGAPGVGGEGSVPDAIDAYMIRSSRRSTATPFTGVTPRNLKRRAKTTIYSILNQDLRMRPTPDGISVPAIPNPSGIQVFKGAWKGGRVAALPFWR